MTVVGRRTLLRASLAGGAGLLAGCGSPGKAADPPPQPAGARRLRYGYDYQQYVDVRRPDRDAPATVVLLHGGYWQAPYGADLMENLATTFGRLGYATANVEYRRVGSEGGYPSTFEDVAAAIDRLGDEDLPDLVAVGHSAGGHLAAWAASRNDQTPGGSPERELRAAISLSGVLDLTRAADEAGSSQPTTALMGGSPLEVPERYRLGDPSRLTPTCPVFACHATNDAVVPVEQSQRYVSAVRAAGGEAAYVTLPGDHLSIIEPSSDAFPTIKGLVARALGPTPIASGS